MRRREVFALLGGGATTWPVIVRGQHMSMMAKRSLDDEGTELADAEEARAEAVVLSGGMLKDGRSPLLENEEWRLRVTDQAGAQMCALTFSADRS